ncbi:hypothetical protein BH10PAT1_BH10PAT1_1960 [soil metagenome]
MDTNGGSNFPVPDESVVVNDSSMGTAPVQPSIPNNSAGAPPITPINSKPKRKLGKIVATIFGLILLVGGVGAGIALVNQNQLLNQHAASDGTCVARVDGANGSLTCINGSNTYDLACKNLTHADCEAGRPYNNMGATCNENGSGGCKWQPNTTSTPACTGGTGISCSSGPVGNSTACTLNGGTQNCCKQGETIVNGACTPQAQTCSGPITCGCNGNPQMGTCANVSGCVRQDGCGYVTPGNNLNFVGCGTNGKLDATGPAGHGGCQNCFNNNGTVSCQTQTTSCGAKVECSGSGGGSNTGGGGSTSACSGDCITSYGGFNLSPTSGNCGQIGRPEGSGSCSNGGRCCNAPGGSSSTPAPTVRTCGEACGNDAECQRGNSASICSKGVCVNKSCTTQTAPGKNCACTNTVTCGQQPLFGQHCATGSEHGFINVPTNKCANYEVTSGSKGPVGYEYCIPSAPTHGYKFASANCSDLQVKRLAKADGSVTGLTQQDVLTACQPDATPTPSPSPTPIPTVISCTNVSAYDSNWNLLSGSDLASLSSGTSVYFTVKGTTTGAFDKAKFTVNGTVEPDSTSVKPGTTAEYYFQYTIPANVLSFTVTAQLHDSTTNLYY